MYACPDLLESTQRFIQRNFEDVSRTEDFVELTFNEVESLIKLDSIFVSSEETIVEAVLAWCSKSEVGKVILRFICIPNNIHKIILNRHLFAEKVLFLMWFPS